MITNINNVKNSLQHTTEKLGISLLIYQAGEAMRFNETAIKLGVSGIQNVMQSIGMLEAFPDMVQLENFKPIFSYDQDWLRAHRSGVLLSEVELGQKISKGEVIGRIHDPFSPNSSEIVYASQDGVVVGINRHPLIHEGKTIFKIASFIDNKRAQDLLEIWNDQQTEVV